jgi:hypothetical protein
MNNEPDFDNSTIGWRAVLFIVIIVSIAFAFEVII